MPENDVLAARAVLQLDTDHRSDTLSLLEREVDHLEGMDVALASQDSGDLRLEPRCRDVDALPPYGGRVADSRQHIGDRISHGSSRLLLSGRQHRVGGPAPVTSCSWSHRRYRPRAANRRKHNRHNSNLRRNPRGRPHNRHRLRRRTLNLGGFFSLAIFAVVAIGILLSTLTALQREGAGAAEACSFSSRAAHGGKPRCIRPALHPTCLRSSSVKYCRYSPSSRLGSRAHRCSRCNAGFHHGLLVLSKRHPQQLE